MLNHVMVEILRMAWATLEEANECFVVDIKTDFPFRPFSSFKNINDADKFQIRNFFGGKGEVWFVRYGGCSHGLNIKDFRGE